MKTFNFFWGRRRRKKRGEEGKGGKKGERKREGGGGKKEREKKGGEEKGEREKKGKGREKTALAAARVDHLEDAVDGEDGFDIDAHHEQMESTFHALQRTFGALRSSGASTSMLDSTAATVPPPLWLF